MTAADRPSVTPRVGDTITTAEQLDALWRIQDVLIEATGTYANGQGTFTKCWARPVPEFVGGEPGTWEVLVFGTELPHSLTTSDRIDSATVRHVPGEQHRPSVTDDARAEGGRVGQIDCLDCGAMAVTVHHFDQCPAVWGAAGRAETTTATDEDAARVIANYLDDYSLPANYSRPISGETHRAVAENVAPLIARELDRHGLLATARTRPTRQQIAKAIHNSDLASGRSGTYRTGDGYYENADAVLALLADQLTEAEAGARALEQAADEIDWEWETYTAPDGIKSIRPHGAAPSTLLRERAARLRGGDRDE